MREQRIQPKQELYQFRAYKDYLKSRVGPSTERRGIKRAMASALNCQPTYVSQVLNGHAHFSLEQGEILADFFAFSESEKHFFLLLIQRDRAGTTRLQAYFDDQIDGLLAERMILTKRLGSEHTLSQDEQSQYYSSWHFAAIHMAVTIPNLREPSSISRALQIPMKRTLEVLEFLRKAGLVLRDGGHYHPGKSLIRLGKNSQHILKHHTNWRLRAVDSLEREVADELHYSAVISLSKSDVARLKNQFLEFISDTLKVVRASKEEKLFAFNLDFFDLLPPN